MELSIILSSFTLLFFAELGDKTQFIAMTLAHRYRLAPVIAGVFLAFLVLDLVAVMVGTALFHYVPQDWVLLAAGGLFLFFAWRSWLEGNGDDADHEHEAEPTGGRSALAASFALIFLAELGDKTQLAIIALAAGTGKIWSVFVGGTLALWVISLIGILLGATLLRKMPKVWMHRGAAALFLVFGLLAVGPVAFGE